MCPSGATCVASTVKTQELSSCGVSTLTSHNNTRACVAHP
jgi:hypothetical protein